MDTTGRPSVDLCRKYGGKRWTKKHQKPLDLDVRPSYAKKTVSPYRKRMKKEFMKDRPQTERVWLPFKLPYNVVVEVK